MQSSGLNRSVALLRGRPPDENGIYHIGQIQDWMLTLEAPDGRLLHGGGCSRSDAWWKALADVLANMGLLTSQTQTSGRFSYTRMQGQGAAAAHTSPLAQGAAAAAARTRCCQQRCWRRRRAISTPRCRSRHSCS